MRTYAPTIALVAALLLGEPVPAADPVQVQPAPAPPAAKWVEVAAKPGQLLGLTASAPAKWVLVDDAAAALLVQPGGTAAVFTSGTPGRYRLVVCGADGADPARVVVVVGGTPPPNPKPPDPDPPADPLRAKLKAAFDADGGAPDIKDAARKDLAELYRQAARLAADPAVTTTGELVDRVRRAAQTLAPDLLPGTRKVVGGELAAAFPADVPLDAPTRLALAALFAKLSDALGW